MSGFTALAASHISWQTQTASSRVRAVVGPVVPLVVRPTCGTRMSAPALAMAAAWSGSKA